MTTGSRPERLLILKNPGLAGNLDNSTWDNDVYMQNMEIIFGPVPSRRLGRSLGINNIPPKICSYACVYCQLGRTIKMRIRRQAYYRPVTIFELVQNSVNQWRGRNEPIDYLAFVPDGEPTLDVNLGTTIALLKSMEIPIAVISNGSLITGRDVREALKPADWVSMKVDAVNEHSWRLINRPHGNLDLDEIHAALLAFRKDFRGVFTTETMLIEGTNDSESHFIETGMFLGRLDPDIAYVTIPTRPPADRSVKPANPERVDLARRILSQFVKRVEVLTGYEGNTFSSTGDIRRDVLSITAVHPLRQDALFDLLRKTGADWRVIDKMLEEGELIRFEFEGNFYFLKNLSDGN